MKLTTIDSEGFCFCCRKKLVTIDLDPQETENFAQSLCELAFARESKTSVLKKIQEWLDRHGPFDAIIDGANIGLFNQNFSQGGFNFVLLNAVVRTAQEQRVVSKSPLIFLHQARTRFGAANCPTAQKFLVKWSLANSLYTTPNGSDDDSRAAMLSSLYHSHFNPLLLYIFVSFLWCLFQITEKLLRFPLRLLDDMFVLFRLACLLMRWKFYSVSPQLNNSLNPSLGLVFSTTRYWLYAAVKNRCLLITNDEMRDHLFQLLGNDFFPRCTLIVHLICVFFSNSLRRTQL